MDIFSESYDPKRDLPKDRVIPLDNGNNYHIVQQDPYGFWYIHLERGSVPDKLSGAYTTFDKAEQAVKIYLNSRPVTAAKETAPKIKV